MDTHGISKLDLKRINRMQILKVIRKNGPISRVDIAGILEITRAAVTIITNEMIEEGVLYEVGEAPVSLDNLQKGRRKILIDINPNFKFSLGIAISDSSVSIGISNLKPEVMDKTAMSCSENTTYDEIIDFIAAESARIMKDNCLDPHKMLGAGISVQPELCGKMKVYFKDGKLDFSSLVEIMEKKLNLPVTCMNSISALALSNQELSTEERFGNYVFVKFGRNINMSVLLENEVMHEYVNHTNQVERFILVPGGAKLDGFPDGSVKAELTRDAVVAKYAAVLSKTDTPIFWEATEGSSDNINYKTIIAAASKGETKVLEVLDGVIRCIAVLLNNMTVAVFARHVILHNFLMDEWLFDYFKKKVADICGEELARKIRLSNAENNLEFKSGCVVAIDEYFFNSGGCQ